MRWSEIDKLFFNFYFFNQDVSLNIHSPTIKFHTLVANIHMQGTMSQIF